VLVEYYRPKEVIRTKNLNVRSPKYKREEVKDMPSVKSGHDPKIIEAAMNELRKIESALEVVAKRVAAFTNLNPLESANFELVLIDIAGIARLTEQHLDKMRRLKLRR
jgi:hypothetical protein